MDAIEISGARYVRATDAARIVGYTTDYVGQLSRAGKIEAQRIGRVWYVKEEDILAHKKGKGRSNKQKTQQQFQKTKSETEVGQIHHVMYDPTLVPEFRKRLLDIDVKYERDESPLFPPTERQETFVARLESKIAPEVARGDNATSLESKVVSEIAPERDEVPVVLPVISEEKKGAEYQVDVNKWEKKPLMQGQLVVEDLEESEEIEAEKVKERVVLHKPMYVRKDLVRGIHPAPLVPTAQKKLEPQRAIHRTPVIPLRGANTRALGLPFVTALVPLALFLAFALSFSGLFVEQVLVYERGVGILQKPSYERTYGIREVSAVVDAVSNLALINQSFR